MFEIVCYQWNVKHQDYTYLVWKHEYKVNPVFAYYHKDLVPYKEMKSRYWRLEYQYVLEVLSDPEAERVVLYSETEYDPEDFKPPYEG